jgi:hypothetical protein
MTKRDELMKYSNPDKVLKLAKQIYGHNVNLAISTQKNKKYMIYDPNRERWIHFGFFGMEDYTKHNDNERRESFKKRNHKWANMGKYSPAYMAYHLLW